MVTQAEIDTVRLKTSDQPVIRREKARGDGVTFDWKLELDTILVSPAPEVRINNVLKAEGTDYTIDYVNGVVFFTAAPVLNDSIIFQYYGIIYTNDEITLFINEAGGNLNYAAALNLMAWAANAARLAKKETQSGGGGLGLVTLDLAVRAQELRQSAKGYMELYEATGASGSDDSIYAPADGITEVAWTEFSAKQIIAQSLIRDD